jgi:hypothetical protein
MSHKSRHISISRPIIVHIKFYHHPNGDRTTHHVPLENVDARCSIPRVCRARSRRFSIWSCEHVVRQVHRSAAPHHLPEGLPEILAEERVEEGIETRVQVGQHVADDLNRHSNGVRLVQVQRLEHQHYLDRSPADGKCHDLEWERN